MNKKIFFLACLVVLTYGLTTSLISAETLDRIVAVVNDEAITQSELDSLLVPIYEQYRSVYVGKEFASKMTEARTNLLNQLIEDRLVSQEAKRLGVIVTEEEINAQVEEIKKKFASESEFENFLTEQNMTLVKLRKKFKEQVAIRKLHQYEIRQKIVVSPLEVEEYYKEHIDDFSEKEKLKVSTIMIKKREIDEDGVDVAKQQIEKIVDELNGGASFAELAKQYSEGMNSEEGGQLGFIKKGEMISTFDSVLFDLFVGERSPILETEIGYHIFLVEAKQEKKVLSLSEVKEEINNIIFRKESKERYGKWMGELKQNAYISIK